MSGTPLVALNWKTQKIKRKINSEKDTKSLYIVILAVLYRCLKTGNPSFAPLPLRRLNELKELVQTAIPTGVLGLPQRSAPTGWVGWFRVVTLPLHLSNGLHFQSCCTNMFQSTPGGAPSPCRAGSSNVRGVS